MSSFSLPKSKFSTQERTRIDILGAEESVESKSANLLEKLKNGEITVSDLMGPLYGAPSLTPEIYIPPGEKVRYLRFTIL